MRSQLHLGRRLFAALAAMLATTVVANATALPKTKDGQPSRATPVSAVYTAVPVTIGVTSLIEIAELNAALVDVGHEPLSKFVPNLSVSITRGLRSGLIIEPQYRFSIVASEETTLTSHHLFLNVGYAAAARGEVFVYPVIGAGFGNTTLEIAVPDVAGPSFSEILSEPRGDALLSSVAFVLHAGFSANLWGSGNGDFIGLRVGLTIAPLSSGWKRRGYDVSSGPPPAMSGGYLALAFGFHTPSER